MATFLRLFIIADIAYMVFMLSRPAAARRKMKREKERQAAARQAKAAAKRQEQAAAAAKASKPAPAAAQPKRKRGRPRKEHAAVTPVAPPPAPEPVQPEPIRPVTIPAAPPPFKGNNAFVGEVVAFTGKLDGMTRAQAIKAVEANGGKAFETMPAGTTILVVGDKPGMNKLDKADRWIGQVRKITQAQFQAKLSLPLTLSPDEFADAFAPRK